MSKIFEALQHAHAERIGVIKGSEARHSVFPPAPKFAVVSDIPSFGLEAEMLMLRQNIASFLPDPEKNIIQFVGARERAGTSTLAREFCRVSAEKSGASILLVEANLGQYEQHQKFGVEPKSRLDQLLHSGKNLDQMVSRIGKSNLFLACLAAEPAPNSSKGRDLWAEVRKEFDLIVIDSSSVSSSVDGLALCSCVDGVVLVIEAEKTRSPVAKSAKDSILQSGGNLLGIVFNKRRYYIPEFIYKFL